MVYSPRHGEVLELGLGQAVFSFHSGPAYILSGQVRYKLELDNEPFFYTLGPGSLIGLEQAHLPEGLLRCSVLEPLRICRWSSSGLETYLGKDLQFALVSLLSLSQQQRRLNQELARRWEAQSSLNHLKTLAQQHLQEGDANMAQEIYRQMTRSFANHELTPAIRELLAQLQREQQGPGPLKLSGTPSHLSQETQLSLYQLAFGGIDGLNQDILSRFGRSYSPGSILCQENADGDELYLLLKGSVEVKRKGQLLGQLCEGDLVGEMAVLEGRPRSATVTAISETVALALNRDQFQMIFQLHPSWSWKLLQGFSERIAKAYQLLAAGLPKKPDNEFAA